MSQHLEFKRLATGVPGLDQVLGGGLPEFSFNVIAGPPGCGKTTLAHQMMFALASAGRPALYFTVLGEPPLKMLRYQQQFDFYDTKAVNSRVRYVDLADAAAAGDFEPLLRRIAAEVGRQAPGLVFIDSFRSMSRAGSGGVGGEAVLQRFVQDLGMLMTSWQATSFLIGEYETDGISNPVFTVADGLIWLRQSVQRNSMVRKLEIVKMRGQATLPGLHSFRIAHDGLHVFPPAVTTMASETSASAPLRRLPMGNARLDEMLGGGLPRGYSLLVAGPSGSGKSILAAAFLAEGARRGEGGVIAAFEPRPGRSRNPLLAGLVAAGSIAVVDSSAPDLSIDEVVLLILDAVRRLQASRVVIDSLSGFELALAPTFQEDFRASLARLVVALAASGVTVLMTCELEDRYTDLRFSPYGTAFLTDAIVLQRYVEVDSHLQRVMAVVKLRASAHCDELRAYTIDDDGIHIGVALAGEQGLLGGRPRRVRELLDVEPEPSA